MRLRIISQSQKYSVLVLTPPEYHTHVAFIEEKDEDDEWKLKSNENGPHRIEVEDPLQLLSIIFISVSGMVHYELNDMTDAEKYEYVFAKKFKYYIESTRECDIK